MALNYLFLVLVLLGPAVSAADWQPHVIGEAYNRDGSALLYRELHRYSDNGKRHQVIYKNHQDLTIAEKTLDYQQLPWAPAFTQQQYFASESQAPELLEVKWQDQDLVISNSAEDLNKRIIPDDPGKLVIDAGFNRFIQHHWSQLQNRQTLEFEFVFPSDAQIIALRLQPQPCAGNDTSRLCLRIKPQNWLLRLFAATIDLEYDRDSKKLLRYRGLSNIKNLQGQAMVVDIHYQYPESDQLSYYKKN